jgi:hypothetical protein
LNRWNRQSSNPIASTLFHGFPAMVALLVLLLGPFVVQCRAPNGTTAAKLLFAACPAEVGCCASCEDDASAPAVDAATNSGMTACGVGPCDGCTESSIFWFVGGRGLRDDAGPAVAIPFLLAELHPASESNGEIATTPLADESLLEAPPPLPDSHRILRI